MTEEVSSSMEEEGNGTGAPMPRRFTGDQLTDLKNSDALAQASPTWRGWVVGLLSVGLMCKLIPICEFGIRGTRLTFIQLPYGPIFLIFVLIIFYNVGVYLLHQRLRLSRQDLALIFCMTLMANHIPGRGFLTYFAMETAGSYQYASPENEWAQWIHPYIPNEMVPHDPKDPASLEPRPIEWLYTGVPEGEGIPFGAWVAPYLAWASMILLLYMLLFSTCLLLRKQWSEREKLPFPLAQVPHEMWRGMGAKADSKVLPFLKDPYVLWAIALVLAWNSWNALAMYVDKWPIIPKGLYGFDKDYLTEPPWNRLVPLKFSIVPSAVGLVFLISKEIGFSIVFFFILLKVAVFSAVGMGYGESHSNFTHTPSGWNGMFINQGMGALIAMVLTGTWMARGALWRSLREALGLVSGGDDHEEEGVSPRTTWIILLCSFCGLVGWLLWMNVAAGYAILAVLAVWVISTGVARLVSEGGTASPEVKTAPVEFTLLAQPPAAMGAESLVPLSMWSKVCVFDQFRVSPMVNIITAMEVGSLSGVRRRPLVLGMFGALLIALAGSFWGFFHTLYTQPQAVNASWVLQKNPRYEFGLIGQRSAQIKHYKQKKEDYQKQGKVIPQNEVPGVAKRDYQTLGWLGTGLSVMLLLVFLRTRVFWLPHPIGYVLWMGQGSLTAIWFSVFLGWLFKWAILKFGGARTYQRWRGFFIGLIVGEALSAIVWIVINGLTDVSPGFKV